jgi:hypothetical protein
MAGAGIGELILHIKLGLVLSVLGECRFLRGNALAAAATATAAAFAAAGKAHGRTDQATNFTHDHNLMI